MARAGGEQRRNGRTLHPGTVLAGPRLAAVAQGNSAAEVAALACWISAGTPSEGWKSRSLQRKGKSTRLAVWPGYADRAPGSPRPRWGSAGWSTTRGGSPVRAQTRSNRRMHGWWDDASVSLSLKLNLFKKYVFSTSNNIPFSTFKEYLRALASWGMSAGGSAGNVRRQGRADAPGGLPAEQPGLCTNPIPLRADPGTRQCCGPEGLSRAGKVGRLPYAQQPRSQTLKPIFLVSIADTASLRTHDQAGDRGHGPKLHLKEELISRNGGKFKF